MINSNDVFSFQLTSCPNCSFYVKRGLWNQDVWILLASNLRFALFYYSKYKEKTKTKSIYSFNDVDLFFLNFHKTWMSSHGAAHFNSVRQLCTLQTNDECKCISAFSPRENNNRGYKCVWLEARLHCKLYERPNQDI